MKTLIKRLVAWVKAKFASKPLDPKLCPKCQQRPPMEDSTVCQECYEWWVHR